MQERDPTITEAGDSQVEPLIRSPFRGKSTFIPPNKRNASLDTYCRLVERDVTCLLEKKKEFKIHDNLTKEQRTALKALREDKSIVIQSADKGGAIVIMDRTAYDSEIQRQLNNTTFYRKLSHNPTQEFKQTIHKKLDVFLESGDISKPEHTFMTIKFPVTPVLYTLPKIHKSYKDIPMGRPIVAAIGSLTENISAFVDYFLQPLVINLPSYVKDSMDFLKLLKSIELTDEPCLLVTMDIESLYTNVPFEGGLRASEFFLNLRPICRPSTSCIVELIEIVLKSNFFLSGSDYYLQISGTSMGSKMAPSFASLYCGHFEHQVIFNEQRNPFLHKISHWKRYIDDIFFIWKGSAEELSDFHNFINSNAQSLRFTIEQSAHEMNFLDILVYKERNTLGSTLYRKSTDRNSILHGESFHPITLKRGLPMAQFSRIRRICSKDQDFQVQATDLEKRLKQRLYKPEWIEDARCRYEQVSQDECLQRTKVQNSISKVNCIVQYSPIGNQISDIVNKHWHIIQSDPGLKVFTSPPRVVFKRPPNLRNGLVRAHLPSLTSPHFLQEAPPGNYRCGRCAQCNFTYKTKTFNHPHTGKSFDIKGTITCHTSNVIYMLKCPCGRAYIGKTTRPLKTRISEHRSNIRNCDPKSPVAVHFTQSSHNLASLRYCGIEVVKTPPRGGDINSLLLRREAFWIYTLDTLFPKGMNEEFDLRPFL
nr:uncharacterized protein LOC129438772 isoform X1 [Misgurnus anguillicaudatus]